MGSRLTVVLLMVLVVSQYFTGCTTVTVVSRLIFSLARDQGVPMSEDLIHVNDKGIPDRAVWTATVLSVLFISPFPFSEFVFNAVLSAATVTANLTYGMWSSSGSIMQTLSYPLTVLQPSCCYVGFLPPSRSKGVSVSVSFPRPSQHWVLHGLYLQSLPLSFQRAGQSLQITSITPVSASHPL